MSWRILLMSRPWLASCLMATLLTVLTGSGRAAQAPFALPQLHDLGGECTALATGDFDADGDVDVATLIAGTAGDGVQLFRNDGTGVLSPWTQVPAGGGHDLFAFDVDHDGNLDLVIAPPSGLRLLRGVGDGTFTPGPLGPQDLLIGDAAFGDVDRDGWLDIAIAEPTDTTVTVLFGAKRLAFPKHWSTRTTLAATAIGFADVDGDRRIELVVAEGGLPPGRLEVYGRASQHVLRIRHSLPLASSFTDIELADLDGDGAAEVLLEGSSLVALRLAADGTATEVALPAPLATRAVVADLDRDAMPDIVVNGPDREFSGFHLLWGLGADRFTSVRHALGQWAFGSNEVSRLAPADLDRDGDLDLLATFGSPWRPSRTLAIVRHLAPRSFGTFAHYELDKLRGVRAADLDGDGRDELIVRTLTGIDRMRMGRDGMLEVPRPLHGPVQVPNPYWEGLPPGWCLVQDLNADGRDDLVLQDDEIVRIALANLDGSLAPDQICAAGKLLGAGDLDGDGDVDLASLAPGRQLSMWSNAGDGTMEGPVVLATLPADSTAEARATVADVDGDGRAEIILAARSDGGGIWLWTHRLLPGPALSTEFQMFKGTYSLLSIRDVCAADLDHTGSPELLLLARPRESDGGVAIVARSGVDGVWRVADESHVAPEYPERLQLADFDGDGFSDFSATMNREGVQATLQVSFNDGSGRFSVTSPLIEQAADYYAKEIAPADLDGDGRPEIAIAAAGAGYLPLPGSICLLLRTEPDGLPLVRVAKAALDAVVPPTATGTSIHAAGPNPVRGSLVLSLRLGSAQPARLELFDVRGRRVHAMDVEGVANGEHSFTIPAGRLAPGLYWARLRQGDASATARVVLLGP